MFSLKFLRHFVGVFYPGYQTEVFLKTKTTVTENRAGKVSGTQGMRFYERFKGFRRLRSMGKCTNRHLFFSLFAGLSPISDAGKPGSTKSTGSGRGICKPAERSDRRNSRRFYFVPIYQTCLHFLRDNQSPLVYVTFHFKGKVSRRLSFPKL